MAVVSIGTASCQRLYTTYESIAAFTPSAPKILNQTAPLAISTTTNNISVPNTQLLILNLVIQYPSGNYILF